MKQSETYHGENASQPDNRRPNGGAGHTMTTSTNAIANTIEVLREHGGLTGVDVANVVEVSKATVSRWSTGKAAPQPRTQLVLSDLRYVADRLAEFYTPGETRTWLYSRNALLNGARAMDLIHEGRTEEVLGAIERLAAAAYL